MKTYYFLLLCLMSPGLAYSNGEECLEKIKSVLETPSEHYLFKNRPYVIKHFDLECTINNYGDSTYNSDSFVFIHEAAHFEDLQIEDEEHSEVKLWKFNLYTVNDEHIGNLENTEELPSVKSLIRPYLEKNKPSYLEDGSIFMDHHDGYIAAEDSMAADHLQGMSTETNGYTHGLVIQARVQSLIPAVLTFKDETGREVEIPNPFKGKISQAEGLYYFIFNFNLYLKILKDDHPQSWEKFYTEKNKTFLRKLFLSSIQSLDGIEPCKLRKTDEALSFYIDELQKEDMSILEEIVGSERISKVTCSKDNLLSP